MLLADQAERRIAYQYQNAPSFKAFVRALVGEYDTVYETLLALETRLDIDVSEGAQLDGIGEIVGQPRPNTIGSVFLEFPAEESFAFVGGVGRGFSGVDRLDVGGRFVGLDGSGGRMIDADYRTLLRAKIFANYAGSDVDSLGSYAMFVFGARATILLGVGFIDITVQKPLAGWERRLIEITLPVAAGIRIRLRSFALLENPFGFAGNDASTGFGAIGVEPVGGGFVGLF